ncbi:MAG: hypothetical protein MN733_29930 [Nitrososphaera sp.]|nr:hypothetical protein [Nitrososphaera sp.]
MSIKPRPPVLRAGNYDEGATFGDLTAIFKHMIENHIRYALTSPPLLKDISEGTVVIDEQASPPRIYMNINQTLYYIAFTAA